MKNDQGLRRIFRHTPLTFAVFLGCFYSACLSRKFVNVVQSEDSQDSIEIPQSRIDALIGAATYFPVDCTPDGRFCASFAPKDLPLLRLIDAVSKAQKDIIIATYNFNAPELGRAVANALDRGVKVEFLHDFKHVFPSADETTKKRIWHLLPDHPNLTRWAVPVLRGSNPQMHNKLILIDDSTLFLGSANWTMTGLVGNFENILAIRDPHLITLYKSEIGELRMAAQRACAIFAKPAEKCGTPHLKWDTEFHQLASKGSFAERSMRDRSQFYLMLGTFYQSMHSTYDQLRNQNLSAQVLRDKLLKSKRDTLANLEKPVISASGNTTPSSLLCRHFQFQDVACDCISVRHELQTLNLPEATLLAENLKCENYRENLRGIYSSGVCMNGGLLDEGNQGDPKRISGCLTNPTPFLDLADELGRFETLVDGNSPRVRRDYSEDLRSKETVIAFSPEDQPENLLVSWIEEIASAAQRNKNTFLYTSTNFVTNHKMTEALTRIKKNGGRLQIMFDRGRWDDPSFQQKQGLLSTLGVFHGRASDEALHDPNPAKSLTIFHNDLIGSYGANHNKMAIAGSGESLFVTTGSANWSFSGMHRNDENVFLSKNPWLATIYAKEIISELYAYRYAHYSAAPFLSEIEFLSHAIPCLDAALGRDASCTHNGVDWKPQSQARIVIGIRGIPVGTDRSVWIRLKTADGTISIPAFSHQSFSGNWVTSLPVPRASSDISFKFYHAPIGHNPNQGLEGVTWEYEGPDRIARSPELALICTHQDARWGQRTDINWCR